MPPVRPAAPTVRARFFRYAPDVTHTITEWAKENEARVVAIIPVYLEDDDDAR